MTVDKQPDLSKIDFEKLNRKLPNFKGQRLRAEFEIFSQQPISAFIQIHEVPSRGWIAYRDESGEWHRGVGDTGFSALLELHAICKQVDAFIESELAEINKPNWVDVQWTEVERLEKAGAHVQYKTYDSRWTDRRYSDQRTVGDRLTSYQVDLNTVPAGVALYEQEWVNIDWDKVERIAKTETEIQVFDVGAQEWVDRPNCCRGDKGDLVINYRFDAKTLPDGLSVEQVTAETPPTTPSVTVQSIGPVRAEFNSRCPPYTEFSDAIKGLADIIDRQLTEIRERIK